MQRVKGGAPIQEQEHNAEQALIHREIFDETLEECERLLFAAEQELQRTRRTAEIAARRRADELVQATSSALTELTEATEADREATKREREQAEHYRVGAERIQAALRQRSNDLEVEAKALDAQRAELDAALAAAETFRAEAQAVHENAHRVAAALLDAAAVRAELLESTLEERISDVGEMLATLQDLVLEQPARRWTDEEVNIREFLSTTFREISDFRNAELTAANQHADDIIERAEHTAVEMMEEVRREHDQLVAGADPGSVVDVVGVLLAESHQVEVGAGQHLDTDAPDDAPDSAMTDITSGFPPPTETAPDESLLPAPPTAPPPDDDDSNHEQEIAAALTVALDQVEDPSRITDRELADVLSRTDHMLGDHATLEGAVDLARSLAEALRPEEAGPQTAESSGPTDHPEIDDPGPSGRSEPGRSEDSPTSEAPEETDVDIDLTSSGDPIVSLDLPPDPDETHHSHNKGGRVRSFWRGLFAH